MTWKTVLAGILLLVLLLVATKSESLWIDEGDTACYALQPSFHAWKSHLVADTNADCQFPLYMLGIWAWEKVTGPSEFALRSLNALFALLVIAAFAMIGRQLRVQYLWALILIQPFFWIYLNEARPYMLQIASGSILLAGFVNLLESKGEGLGWGIFLLGTILLFYSTLLSFVTLGVFYVAVGFMVLRKEIALPKKWVLWLVLLGVATAPGALYYLQTVLRGVGGAKIWAISPLNFFWVYDEIIGGVGLGPPVWQIREIARDMIHSGITPSTLGSFILSAILALGVAWAFILFFRQLHKSSENEQRLYISLGIIMAAVVFSFAGISVILKKAFWARHLSPVFPVYVLLIYGVLHFLLKEREWIIGRILGILLIVLLLFSSFQVVCSRSYSRDDYRGAAQRAIVTLQQGGTVWWAGSWHCGAYYGLPIAEGLSTLSRLILIQNPTKDMLLSEATPDLILLSRQDVYDGYNNVSAYALVNHFHQSKQTPYLFHLWERHE